MSSAYFSRRREDQKFKAIQRTFNLFVEFHRTSLRQTVRLIAVGAVHTLGLGCYILEVPPALPTPTHINHTVTRWDWGWTGVLTWRGVCRSPPQMRRKPQRAHPALQCDCENTQTLLEICPKCGSEHHQNLPTVMALHPPEDGEIDMITFPLAMRFSCSSMADLMVGCTSWGSI